MEWKVVKGRRKSQIPRPEDKRNLKAGDEQKIALLFSPNVGAEE